MKGSMNGITAMVNQMMSLQAFAGHARASDRHEAVTRVLAGERPSQVAPDFGVRKCTIQRWCWEARQGRK